MKRLGDYNNMDALDASSGMVRVMQSKGMYKNIYQKYFILNSGIKHSKYTLLSYPNQCQGYAGALQVS